MTFCINADGGFVQTGRKARFQPHNAPPAPRQGQAYGAVLLDTWDWRICPTRAAALEEARQAALVYMLRSVKAYLPVALIVEADAALLEAAIRSPTALDHLAVSASGVQVGMQVLYGVPAPEEMSFPRLDVQAALSELRLQQRGRREAITLGPHTGVALFPRSFWERICKETTLRPPLVMVELSSSRSVAAGRAVFLVWSAGEGVWDVGSSADGRFRFAINAEAMRVMRYAKEATWVEGPIPGEMGIEVSPMAHTQACKKWVRQPAGAVAFYSAPLGCSMPPDLSRLTFDEYAAFFGELL